MGLFEIVNNIGEWTRFLYKEIEYGIIEIVRRRETNHGDQSRLILLVYQTMLSTNKRQKKVGLTGHSRALGFQSILTPLISNLTTNACKGLWSVIRKHGLPGKVAIPGKRSQANNKQCLKF